MSRFVESFEAEIGKFNLDAKSQAVLRIRYINIVKNFAAQFKWLQFAHNFLNIFATVLGTILLGLMSINSIGGVVVNNNDNDNAVDNGAGSFTSGGNLIVSWVSWVVALLLAISNATMVISRVDDRYLIVKVSLERLEHEGVTYISQTGMYETLDAPAAFKLFMHSVEEINKKALASMPDMNQKANIDGILGTSPNMLEYVNRLEEVTDRDDASASASGNV